MVLMYKEVLAFKSVDEILLRHTCSIYMYPIKMVTNMKHTYPEVNNFTKAKLLVILTLSEQIVLPNRTVAVALSTMYLDITMYLLL